MRRNPGVDLFSPVTLGDLELANRVAMAPLTRMRSGPLGVPGDVVVEHYAQRAGLGLIVTEGTYPVHESQAFVGQPGIVTDEQVAGWRRVAEAVHARGGRIVLQVMHGGRVTHPEINGGRRVEAPSAIAIAGEARTAAGKHAYPVPHALTTAEVGERVQTFVDASRRAIGAGLDGVELCTAPTATCCTSSSPRPRTGARTSTGAPRRTGRASSSSSRPPSPRPWAPAGWVCGSPRSTASRTRSSPTATTSSPPTGP